MDARQRRLWVDCKCAEYLEALENEDYATVKRIRELAARPENADLLTAINELRAGLAE